MGNINKMRKKKALLSKDGRYYFSTNNFGKSNGQKKVTPITSTNIHYAYYDGKELTPIKEVLEEKGCYKISTYEISLRNSSNI